MPWCDGNDRGARSDLQLLDPYHHPCVTRINPPDHWHRAHTPTWPRASHGLLVDRRSRDSGHRTIREVKDLTRAWVEVWADAQHATTSGTTTNGAPIIEREPSNEDMDKTGYAVLSGWRPRRRLWAELRNTTDQGRDIFWDWGDLVNVSFVGKSDVYRVEALHVTLLRGQEIIQVRFATDTVI